MRRSKQQWLDIINDQQQSGLTAAEYCRNNNIEQKYFSTRKGQLKEELKHSHQAFAKVEIKDQSSQETTLEYNFKNGTLKFARLPDAKWMSDFLGSLL
jgi:hypothetical protein